MKTQPWFSSRNKTIKLVTIREFFTVPLEAGSAGIPARIRLNLPAGCRRSRNPPRWGFFRSSMWTRIPELFALPLAFATGDEAGAFRESAVAELTLPGNAPAGVLYEAFANPAFARTLLGLIRRRERLHNEHSEVEATRTSALRQILNGSAPSESVRPQHGRRQRHRGFWRQAGPEIFPPDRPGRESRTRNRTLPHGETIFRTARRCSARWNIATPPVCAMTLAVAKAFVPHAKNAWKFTLDAISRYYDRVFASATQGQIPPPTPSAQPLKLLHHGPPDEVADHVGTYLESARLLGVRTAELHLALASGESRGDFSTEPMTPHYLRGVFQSMRSLAVQNLRLLRKQIKTLPPELAPVAQRVVELEAAIIQSYRRLSNRTSQRGASAFTATCIWARCCGRGAILSFSILKARRRCRSASGVSSVHRCATWRGCCARSITRRMPAFTSRWTWASLPAKT